MNHSVMFDTDEDQVYDVLLAVAYAFGYDTVADALEEAGSDEEDVGDVEEASPTSAVPGWNDAKMRRFIKALKPTAVTVLRAIAESAPQADITQVQAAAGVDGPIFAGSMSSFGFAARNTRGVREKPFMRSGDVYYMEKSVAAMVLRALDELGL